MKSVPLSDSVRNYRVVEVFISGTDYSLSSRIIGSSVLVGRQINLFSSYGSYGSIYCFVSETAFGVTSGYSYMNNGIHILIIGYNFG